ncbi:hypothetical protein SOY_00631, partial [Enterococcus faecalis EnGen0210]
EATQPIKADDTEFVSSTPGNYEKQMIQNLYQVQQNWMINLMLTNILLKVKK